MRRSINSPIIWASEFLRKTRQLVPLEDPENLGLVANSATVVVLCPLMISFVIIILSRNLPSLVKESVLFSLSIRNYVLPRRLRTCVISLSHLHQKCWPGNAVLLLVPQIRLSTSTLY